jgi:hypothetical protein
MDRLDDLAILIDCFPRLFWWAILVGYFAGPYGSVLRIAFTDRHPPGLIL